MLGIMRSIIPFSLALSLFFANVSALLGLVYGGTDEATKRYKSLFFVSVAIYLLSLSLLVV